MLLEVIGRATMFQGKHRGSCEGRACFSPSLPSGEGTHLKKPLQPSQVIALKWKPVARSPHTPQIRGTFRSKSPGSGREVLAAISSIPVRAAGRPQPGRESLPDAAGALSIAVGHPSLPGAELVEVLCPGDRAESKFFGTLVAWLSSPIQQEKGSGSYHIQGLQLPAPRERQWVSLHLTALIRRDVLLLGVI